MELKGKTVGFALTGSFCTYSKVIPEIQNLKNEGVKIIPIMSETSASTDTRFGNASYFSSLIEDITEKKPICTIAAAEPIGPGKWLDALVVAPCTGNTLSKIANGIADTAVTLATKSHLRNQRPVVIAVSSNDALGVNAKNLGILADRKNIFLVPFGQDDFNEKQNSLVAHMNMIIPALKAALDGKQIQPLLVSHNK